MFSAGAIRSPDDLRIVQVNFIRREKFNPADLALPVVQTRHVRANVVSTVIAGKTGEALASAGDSVVFNV